MERSLTEEYLAGQVEILLSGAEQDKLPVLSGLYALAEECRAKAELIPYAAFKEPAVRENCAPWREFRAMIGAELFGVLVELVGQERPSRVRAQAGDIMACLWHPCGIGRLLEKFEERRETLEEDPPVRILRDLGAIGTEAAAKALVWLWGSGMDADAAGALGICFGTAAQDFLLTNALVHTDSYVRSICLAHLRPPITKEKADLFITRLSCGTQNERFIAAMKVKEFRLAAAVPALISARARKDDGALLGVIDEAIAALRGVR